MKKDWDPQRLDVRAFGRLSGSVAGVTPLPDMPRLLAEQDSKALPEAAAQDVSWTVTGLTKDLRGGAHQTWMHVQAGTRLHMICQRCLEPMEQPLEVDRHFRFVSSEQAAETEDDQAEEDLLVASTSFDALTLIEDELILALPLVPRHGSCEPPASSP
jgi:uncharacterized protein